MPQHNFKHDEEILCRKFAIVAGLLIFFAVDLGTTVESSSEQACRTGSDSCSPTSKGATMSPKEFVQAKLKEGPVVVFSKTYCPYCKATKQLFNELGVDFVLVELDIRDDGQAIQDYLLEITGGRSVPRVFVGGEFVGGSDATAEYHRNSKLVPAIKRAGGIVRSEA